MRLLYFDVDTLRADHLGCYGYHRATSPAIDAVAAEGVRFDNLYASDTPCLPSRSALCTGRFGIRNGAINHGGAAADPVIDGADRWFQSRHGLTSWARRMGFAGVRTVTISSFAERHSAFHWYAGFAEAYNPGLMGMETADQVISTALDWLRREPAVDAACAERFAAKAGSRPERGTTAYGGTMAVCAVTDLFAAVARAAGPDLTRRGFVDAAGSVGPIELPYGGPASLAPGKPDAADAMRPLVWTARCTCWLPVGGYVRVP